MPTLKSEEQAASRLKPEERRKAVEEEKLNAKVTHEAIRREGIKELERTPQALLFSAFAGGLAMGLILVGSGVLHHGLPEAPWRHLVTSLAYAIGFLAITLGSQQLYTENTLTPIVPLLEERTAAMLRRVLMLGGVVFLGNLIGTALFAWAAARTALLTPDIQESMRAVALQATDRDAMTVFATGILAGFVVALMLWMLPASGSAQVSVIIIMAWLIGAAKLSHVIVSAVEAFYLTALGDMGPGAALGRIILPALLGNTIGGVLFVAAVNHAQVTSE